MSLKINILANYASQLYITLIGIILVPLYVKYMGAEAYGLVGFFAMLQSWFNILDLGLSPTIARESARYRGGAMSIVEYLRLFRALSVIFFLVALLGGGLLWSFSGVIASHWLKVETLPIGEVVLAIEIMAISVALRWMGGLFRGVITGSERMVWLSSFNTLIATIRFIGVMASMWIFGFTPRIFFIHQIFVAIFEISGLFFMSRLLLPKVNKTELPIGWSFRTVQPLIKFSLTIAFTSSVWILVTQTDKLILSGILPLAEYGYFTLAVMVASGILVISGPVSSAIMPRMARLHTEGKNQELIYIYRNSTRLVSALAGSASITLAFCAEEILSVWSGDQHLAKSAAPILTLYAIGNGFSAACAFPYYLQYAKGNLRYHLFGNIFFAAIIIPCIAFSASNFGSIGAGYTWMILNILLLLAWVGFIHYKIEPGIHRSWLIKDVISIHIPTIFAILLLRNFLDLKKYNNTSLIAATIIASLILAFTTKRVIENYGKV